MKSCPSTHGARSPYLAVALALASLACSGSDDQKPDEGGTGGAAGASGSGGAPAYDPPGERGPFPVGFVTRDFVDESREELFNPMPIAGEKRLLVTDIWYPADDTARGVTGADGAGAMAVDISSEGPFPLVVFSHGNTGISGQSNFLTSHLASHGYVVISPNHRFNTLSDFNVASRSVAGLEQRGLDVSFLVDVMTELHADDPDGLLAGKLDLSRVGLTGHSFGGATTLVGLTDDDRFDAGAPITAGGVGELARGVTEPTLHFVATEDQTIGTVGNDQIELMYDLSEGPKVIVRIRDAGHFSPTVGCDVAPQLFATDGCDKGTRLADPTVEFDFLDHRRVHDIVNFYEAAHFGRYLKEVPDYAADLVSNPFGDDVELEHENQP